MKKFLLFILSLSFISLYPQNLNKVPQIKDARVEQLPFSLPGVPAIPAAVLSESFESTTFPPAGWTLFSDGGSGWSRQTAGSQLPQWGGGLFITTPAGGGNAVAYCTYSDDPTFNNQWLITPLIQDIQPADTLFFWMKNHIFSFADTVYIYYSTDKTNFSQIGQVSYPPDGDTNWGKWYITIGQAITAGSDVYIGFRELLLDNQENGGAISLDLISISGGTSNYPSSIPLSRTYSFGDVAQSSSYRLIGIPGNNNTPVTSFISGTHKKDWNVFYDNGAETNFLIEFNGQALFNFTPGKGFWALSRNPINVSGQVNTVALAGGSFNIPLHSGWNIISNPFEKNVSIADIRNSNGLAANNIFFAFNGNFSGASVMNSYEGYYFLNPDDRGSLTIPYPFGSVLEKINEQLYFLSEVSLKLKLKSGDFLSEVMIGFDEGAKAGYDDMDYFAPPGNFEELNIRLVNNDLSTNYKQLYIEHRPEIGEGQSFDFIIKNTTNKNAKLVIEGIRNFPGYEVYIVDAGLKRFYNLNEDNEIEIAGRHQDNRFRLLIGSKDYIKDYEDNAVPLEFSINQNYPNPFNPKTSIQYTVGSLKNSGDKQFISLKVYDMLGNLVTTLVNEAQSPGIYEVEFDGSELSSGIYLYEFSGGNIRSTRKMVLIK